MKSNFSREITSVSALLFFGFSSIAIQSQALNRIEKFHSVDNSLSLSEAQVEILKAVPTVGFRNIVSDWSFIQFLQYFGDEEARQETGYADSAKYLSVTVQYDPYYKDFYVFLSGSSTLYAGQPEETVQVMESGLEQLRECRAPDSYYIWRYKGTDELLFLNDSESAQHSFEMAAAWARESETEEASVIGQVSEQTAQFLENNPNSKQAQINAWASILTTALDDGTRDRAIEHIQALGGEIIVGNNGEISIRYAQADEDSES